MDGLAGGLLVVVGSAGMTPTAAWLDGARRVNRALMLVAGVWAVTLLVSLPLAVVLRGMIAQHLGDSLVGESVASGVNYDWMQEFSDQATGLGVTFRPTVIGFGAVLDNLSAFLDNVRRPMVIVGVAVAYVVIWMFLSGGIIDRLARDRETRAFGFFGSSGEFFFRFFRLGLAQWVTYAALFGWLHPLLFERWFPRMIHEVSVERTAFLIRLALYVVFGAVLTTCLLIFDYAKVRAVVEDRRSMLGSIVAASTFIRGNLGAVVWVFSMNFVVFMAVLAVYGAIAPGAGTTGIRMWTAFASGQLYVLGRLWVKLTFWASETALFQSRFAHTGYVARPQPTWPDSPAAEAILGP